MFGRSRTYSVDQLDGRLARLVGDDGTVADIPRRLLPSALSEGTVMRVELPAGGPPDWVYRATLAYRGDRVSASLTGRGFSSGTYSNAFIECTSGCPASSAEFPTINDNSLPGAFYLDASVSYKMQWAASDVETFFSVTNLTNKDPAMVPLGPARLAVFERTTSSSSPRRRKLPARSALFSVTSPLTASRPGPARFFTQGVPALSRRISACFGWTWGPESRT